MPQIALTINGRSYQVACDEGQEDRIRQLGQYIDCKVGEFAKTWGQIGDARLLLMASLIITDELAEATEGLRRNRAGNGATSAQDHSSATEAVLAAGIESLAARIEAVAVRLESTT